MLQNVVIRKKRVQILWTLAGFSKSSLGGGIFNFATTKPCSYKPRRSLKAKKWPKAMSKGRHLFRESEVRRAVKAAQNAGMKIGRVEIDSTGKISLIPSDDAEATNVERGDQWDTALK